MSRRSVYGIASTITHPILAWYVRTGRPSSTQPVNNQMCIFARGVGTARPSSKRLVNSQVCNLARDVGTGGPSSNRPINNQVCNPIEDEDGVVTQYCSLCGTWACSTGRVYQWRHRPQQQEQRVSLPASQQARPHASEQRQAEAAPPSPQQKPPVTEIDLQDNVTVSQLAALLHVPLQEVEGTLTELGDTPASPEEVLSPANAELVAMVYGKTARFSKAVLVSHPPPKRQMDSCCLAGLGPSFWREPTGYICW